MSNVNNFSHVKKAVAEMNHRQTMLLDHVLIDVIERTKVHHTLADLALITIHLLAQEGIRMTREELASFFEKVFDVRQGMFPDAPLPHG